MTNRAVAALTVTATAAGVLIGAALVDVVNNPSNPQTTITLRPGQSGRCIAETSDGRLRAKKSVWVKWHIYDRDCRLASGGRVQLRFTVQPSPTAPSAPTQNNGNVIHARVNDDAPNGLHAYKVYADFDNDADDYILEDPDLEIVTYGFVGAVIRLLIPFW